MIFDSLITTHNGITYNVSSVEKIYIEQALKLLPSHVLSKIITEGWKIVVFSDVNEIISIDSQLTVYTTGVTKYDLRRVFVKGVTDGRNEISFKSTLIHELVHTYDCIIDGANCNWKTEKYYNSEIENLIKQEGSNFSDYAQSDVKEYVSTVVSRYILGHTDFTNIPLTKAFIEKYFFMSENSLEQRLQNLENNAVTYIELDETYNRLKYSKLNKENDKYIIQLPESSSEGGSTSNNVIYDNNVSFSTSVSYFLLNKTTISYITETLNSSIAGTWELKTIMGDSSAVAIQIRTFILNGRDSSVTDFTTLPNTQMRYFDYNNSRTWTSWVDKISSLETRVTALETNGGNSSGVNVNIDDNNISSTSTWSSTKIEDFVQTNDYAVWSIVEGNNLSIQYTKEGYLRDVEILGNTISNNNGVNLFDEVLQQGDISSSSGENTESTSRVRSVNFIDIKGATILYVYRDIAGGNFAFRCYDSNKKYLGSTSADRNNQAFSSTLITNTAYVRFIDETYDLNNKYTIALESVSSYIPYSNEGTTYNNLGKEINGQYKIDIESRNYLSESELTTIEPKIYNKSILLPCQLCSTNNIFDRVYWDNEKNKYVIEKKIDNNVVLETTQIIETDITEILKIPCYINNTYLFVTGGIDGNIKVNAPIDGGQAIQSLSIQNENLNNEVSTLSLENEEIKEVNNTQDELIDTSMLATDELYTMIEPILESIPQTVSLEGGVSRMVELYVAMIQRGLKTIEQVPTRYREEVRRILEEVEK